MLIINPNATAIRRGAIESVERAVSEHARLVGVTTRTRGHAIELASRARDDGYDLVIAFGGDGTVNEVVQGLLGDPAESRPSDVPAFAAIPGGYGNTFIRNLGFPFGVRKAARHLSAALAERRTRTVGLGLARATAPLADDGHRFRWVCFSAGLGFDAEIIRSIEQARSGGMKINGARYVATATRHALLGFDRRNPHLTVLEPEGPSGMRAFWAVVQNTSPYAYVNRWNVTLAPRASFDTGLDLFSLYDMSTPAILNTSRKASNGTLGEPDGVLRRGAIGHHDLAEVRIGSACPISLQIDGEGIGMVDGIECRSMPGALRVYA